ncbi:MAG: N-acetylmuramoyl-L-alanine amidase, family 2 [Blastococcus sp.]|nr:N-acetylmuramoyl-L-alanine amidase, family 2 [Blastococcus sp.]
MRRCIAGFTAFLVLTGTFLVLPVYAAPTPEVVAVPPSIDRVELGSVEAPAGEAVVTTDGELVAAGEDAEVVVVPDGQAGAEVGPAERGQAGAAEQSGAATSSAPVESSPEPEPAPSSAPSPVDADSSVTGSQVEVPTTGDEIPGVPALTVSETRTDAFSAVGVTWADDPALVDVRVQIRVQQQGAWGEWTLLETDDVEQGPGEAEGVVRDGTAPYYTGPANGIEVTVQGADGSTPSDIRAELIDPGTSAADTSLGAPQVQDQAHAGLSMPPIYSRAQWGADESIRTWDPEYTSTLKAATVHHTADRNNYSAAEVPSILRSIYAYHTLSRAWGDIGYNVIVDKFGRAWEGRYSGDRGIASPVIGAHAGGFNSYTVGVSMLGNFEAAPAPQPMIDTVAAVIGWKLGLYGVDPRGWTKLTSAGGGTSKYAAGVSVSVPTVFGHRDVGSTACPGVYGYARLDEVRAKAYKSYVQRSTPTGVLDAVAPSFGRATVQGWVLDLDVPQQAVIVHAYVDGVYRSAASANGTRSDVGRAFPPAGDAHGYRFAVDLTAGTHRICVYALNAGGGSGNPMLGCRSVTVSGFQAQPVGAVDGVGALGNRIGFTGWALDGSAPTQALSVHVYLDGRPVDVITADRSRPDIAAAFPGAQAAHGFTGTVPASPGAHVLCLYAMNVGSGNGNPTLKCSNVVVSSKANEPIGTVDPLGVIGPKVTVGGWMVDPDAPSDPGSVHVYVDGRLVAPLNTDVSRPDIAVRYPGAGVSSARGFRTTLTLDSGTHVVCVYALDQGAGSNNPLLGCRNVTVPAAAWNPRGVLDSASVSGITATIRGWSFDPDQPDAPSSVHLYVDGAFRKAVPADGNRPDVGAAFGVGVAHGLTTKLSIPAGTHSVCGYAINTGRGTTNPFIGCRTVTVAASAWAAYGHLDTATISGGEVLVKGWTVDPDDQARSLPVHVYVNGVKTELVADESRPDIQARYPGAGALHGYAGRLPLPAGGGPYQVCAFAIGVADGATNVPLGCRQAA